ncbi:PH domain-containing protein [Granulicatella balaenopterae]|uniref:PH domain-containing protein n=1 Tax=Granulicatella balaenopterae TaxID=137733 RepID=A0A1H9MEI7_9LACT|nr:PH domain-containing protein [Granulicatella balaenopterae]SER21583.1 PH domain-containing protein [Granulicatella balaenopterae]
MTLEWTFVRETDIPADIQTLLIPGEEAQAAYTTIRDIAIITNKRLIVSDSQGITGRKKEIYSLPFSAINMWSSENAGTLDFTAELELWTRAGHIKINLKRGVDVRKFDCLIAQYVL